MISQRKSPARGACDRPSAGLESGPADGREKFMSAILTYLGFNVTKPSAGTKQKVVLHAVMFKRPEKVKAGGEGRELIYRAIVERHFGKHTGLLPSAKACPGGLPSWKPAAKRVQAKARRNQQRHGAGATVASIREKAHGSFVRTGPESHAGAGNRAGSVSG